MAAGTWSSAQEGAGGVTGMPEELVPGLAPILKTALTRSPQMIRSSIDVAAAEGRRYIGEAALWPTLGANARYAVTTEQTVDSGSSASNTTSGLFYGIDANQPVFHWGALKAQADRDRIGLKITERQYAEAYRMLARTLRRDFLELIAKKADLRQKGYQLELDRQALARAKAEFEAKRATPAQVAGAQFAVDSHQLDLDRSTADFAFARRQLARVAGIDALSEDAIPNNLDRPKPALDAGRRLFDGFTKGGVKETFQAESLALNVQRSEQDYIIAKRRLYPKFSLFAGYNVRNETQADVNSIRQVAVASRNYGLKLDWNIFDGWQTKGEKLYALSNRRAYERELETHIEANLELAGKLWQDLGFAARALDIAENGFGGAQALVTYQREELAQGRATEADVNAALLGLRAAEAGIIRARADYLNHWTEFVSLVGADPAQKNIPARYVR
jgi:outer membrane protein TolC